MQLLSYMLMAAVAVLSASGCAHGPTLAQRTPYRVVIAGAIPEKDTEFRGKILYQKQAAEPFTGSTVRYDDSGQIESHTEWSAGLLHGVSTDWHENGVVKEQSGWSHDRPAGTFRQWDRDGRLFRYGDWHTGEWLSWDERGKLIDREVREDAE